MEGHPSEIAKRSSDWSQWAVTEGKISDSTTADRACEFYDRYASDVEICRKLNLNCFRLSLNWPALCPEPPAPGGQVEFDAETVKYYRKLLSELKNDGTRTFVTLFHFTLPRWLADNGGWERRETSDAFAVFAAMAAEAFGDLVDYWITINEPLAYAYQGYVNGVWPPGHKGDYLGAFTSVRNMLFGHAKAYAAIRKQCPNSMVSFTMHWRPFRAKHMWNPLDHLACYYRHYVFNEMFPKAVEAGVLTFPYPLSKNPEVQKIAGPIEGLQGTMDYLAINYYTRELSEFYFTWPLDLFGRAASEVELETSCMGWELYPDGLYNTLSVDLLPFRYNKDGSQRPIFITENGFATEFTAELDEGDWSLADDQRVNYLTSHLMALHRAIENGANVRGYMYWSLMDNFEWAEGLRPRFGLVRIAYPSQSRTLRKSAEFYAEIARYNRLRLASNS